MSSNYSTSSDDDKPLGSMSVSSNGLNGHVSYANGKLANGKSTESSMSEDETPLSQSSRVKSEPITPARRPVKRKKAPVSSSSSEDDTPLASSPAKQAKSNSGAIRATAVGKKPLTNGTSSGSRNSRTAKNSKVVAEESSASDDDDIPLGKKVSPNGKAPKAPPKKRVKKEDDDDLFGSAVDDDTDDKPIAKRKRKTKVKKEEEDASASESLKPPVKKRAINGSAKSKAKKEEPPSDTDATPKPRKRATKTKKGSEGASVPASQMSKKEEGDEEDGYKWWAAQDPNGDGSIKWSTLEHNGVYFPPPYEPLPANVKMKYNGVALDLPPESEEVAGFYGAMLETDHAQDAVFNKNFFTDFLKLLKKFPPRNNVNVEKFELCDFRPMFEFFEAEKAKKKSMTAAEKKALKLERDKLEEKYTTCTLDGRKEKVGNFRIEPPGLFRGRGEHPKKGSLKLRVRPEDITINIGEGAPIPQPNMPGKWKKVINDQTVTWLANWTENVNGNHKYVFLAAGSSLKGQSDMMKFEKSRELKNHVDRIRQDYYADLKSKLMADRQRATAMYFIDRLALRAGNEKGEDEADTVGCCSLRCEHVTLEPPNTIVFDFLGKDSIRFFKEVEVEPQIFKNIRIFKENKDAGDALFDRVNTTIMNKHLQNYMKGLTAKVFRTYNASITFQQQLELLTPRNEDASLQEKLAAYNKANRQVAVLCNHQKSVSKNHSASMEKMSDKLKAIKYERMKLRHALFAVDRKYKKKKEFAEEESDLDDDWIESHEKSLLEKEIEKTQKKFEKDNEKLVADGQTPKPRSVLEESLEEIRQDFAKLESERGTGLAELKRARPVEKMEEAIRKLEEKIKNFKLQMLDREEGKEVALGTSKINYLDPRITSAWCKEHNVPIEKLFSKSLLTKFPWAMEVDSTWKF